MNRTPMPGRISRKNLTTVTMKISWATKRTGAGKEFIRLVNILFSRESLAGMSIEGKSLEIGSLAVGDALVRNPRL